MIIHSDNTATNLMIDRLGMDRVNRYLKEHGYKDTTLRRKMMDFDAAKKRRRKHDHRKGRGASF